ncbi:ATP-binding cassette domain-containing protein [Proteinivorax hydrogeniformans]|uniref:ATP-binding cassette domain-containing protein n=1 Tax=Proteinivorax hydrogeniformans TaxID=1826727 RepID=A0AAU8HVS6_9FIRM
MITTTNLSLRYGGRVLFKDVNIKFAPGNCYGLIGANGAGKSTFLKILSGEIEPTSGNVSIASNLRLGVLKQNHHEYDQYNVVKTVIMGHKRLIEIMEEKEAYYAKSDFSDEDGIKLAELEAEFAELNGWDAEADAESILNGLGISSEYHNKKMEELNGVEKVKVLLAQALFGNPDILLLDEPTNHLDIEAINWLENFLHNFENTVIVVSHDRHFLNQVCTHITDIDFSKITVFPGNYDFWYESSQLAQKQAKEANQKTEAKMKELQEFVRRFSANASKSKQATSRKKILDNLELEDIKPSSRRYPFVDFKPDREVGNDLLSVKNLSKSVGEEVLLNDISFTVNKGDKIAILGENEIAKTALFDILMENATQDSGEFKWGVTTSCSYFPNDSSSYFDDCDLTLVDWLRQFSEEKSESFIRGWLGRMLFSGEEALKKADVLSGGEKVRCMLAKMMLSGANVLLFDEPTNHLDLESITALNKALINYKGTLIFTSHDHEIIKTTANRIIEITADGIIDKQTSYEDYLQWKLENK